MNMQSLRSQGLRLPSSSPLSHQVTALQTLCPPHTPTAATTSSSLTSCCLTLACAVVHQVSGARSVAVAAKKGFGSPTKQVRTAGQIYSQPRLGHV